MEWYKCGSSSSGNSRNSLRRRRWYMLKGWNGRSAEVEVEAEKNGGVRLYARLTPFPFLLRFLDFLWQAHSYLRLADDIIIRIKMIKGGSSSVILCSVVAFDPQNRYCRWTYLLYPRNTKILHNLKRWNFKMRSGRSLETSSNWATWVPCAALEN